MMIGPAAGLVPAAKADGADEHFHDGISFAKWTSTNSLPDSGNVYLAGNVSTGSALELTDTLNLCLNGRRITCTGNTYLLLLAYENMTIFDSDDGTGVIMGINSSTTMYSTVSVSGRATLTQKGGTFTHSNTSAINVTSSSTGSGTFIMEGGSISGNRSASGGGVVQNQGVFNMKGGSISNNMATKGGGVFLNRGTFTMSGGEISGNVVTSNGNGGGVYVYQNGTFNLKGNIRITGNTKTGSTTENNVYLVDGKKINITGKVTGKVGVTMENPGVFTSGWKTNMGNADPADVFTSDNPKYYVTRTDDGEATLAPLYSVKINAPSGMTKTADSGAAQQTGLTGSMTDVVYTADTGYYFPDTYRVEEVNGISVTRNSGDRITVSGTPTADTEITLEAPTRHTHDFTYTASGSTVTARCTAGCPDGYDTTGITLTLKAPTNLKYDGNAKEATIDGYPATAPAGLAAKPEKVTYYKSTGAGSTTTSGSALSGAPSGCGNYVAKMTWGGATASLPFSITSDAISFNVKFKVVNGGWNKTGSSDPIVVTLSRAANEDKLLKLEAGDIPAAGDKPSKGYMEGSWNDPAPSTEIVISEDKEYTYTYAAKGTDSLPVTQAGAVYGCTLEDPSYIRPTGTTKDPVITYTGTLWDGSAYGPSAAKPTETGSYTVSVTEETADKIYTGSADFAITPKSLTGATIKLSASQLEYSGSEQSVTVDSVKLDGAVLKETDYTVSGQTKGTFKGTYTVTVTGKGNYKDSESVTWEIVDKSMTVSAPDVSFSYDGNAHGITVSVTDPAGGYTVKYGTEKGTYDLDASPTITNVKEGPKPIYFRVTADNYTAFTGSATVTITKATQAAPAAPTAEEVTENSVTLKVTDGYQYSMDGTNWQDSPVFTGLSKGTEYTFYQRIAGDDNHEPSPAGPGTAVTTAGVVYTVTNVEGGEHYIGNGEDAVITVKCNVDDAHTYNRYTGTKVDGKAVSEASLSTAPGSLVLTLKASYLDKLSIGEHQVTIAFTDGEAETTVTIKDVPPTPPPEPSASPEPTWVPPTGDTANFPLWIGLILLGLTGISVLGLTAPKHRK